MVVLDMTTRKHNEIGHEKIRVFEVLDTICNRKQNIIHLINVSSDVDFLRHKLDEIYLGLGPLPLVRQKVP